MLALAPPPPALPAVKVDSAWVASAAATRVASLSLRGVPSSARVALGCHGGGCPFTTRPIATHRRARVSLTRALRRVRLRVGAKLDDGAATPQPGFDAVGLVQYAYGQVGVALPRVADDQCRMGTPVARADLLVGDVVCFADATGYVDHVGLYAGGDQFLHAPHTGAVVGYNALAEPYYSQRFSGGRRFA